MVEEKKIEKPLFGRGDILNKNEADLGGRPETGRSAELGLEKKLETAQEHDAEIQKEVSEKLHQVAKEDQTIGATPIVMTREQREKKVETLMADGLEDAYLKMNPDDRQKFKKVGEETARNINDLLDRTKVKVKKIVELLKKWLSLLSGVNKFFIEQEAKIRADKISKLKD